MQSVVDRYTESTHWPMCRHADRHADSRTDTRTKTFEVEMGKLDLTEGQRQIILTTTLTLARFFTIFCPETRASACAAHLIFLAGDAIASFAFGDE